MEVCGGISWVLMIAMGLWRHEYPDYMDVEVNFVAVEGDGGKWRQNEVFIHTLFSEYLTISKVLYQ